MWWTLCTNSMAGTRCGEVTHPAPFSSDNRKRWLESKHVRIAASGDTYLYVFGKSAQKRQWAVVESQMWSRVAQEWGPQFNYRAVTQIMLESAARDAPLCHANGNPVKYHVVDSKLKAAAPDSWPPPLYTHGGRQHATIYHAWDGKSDEQVMSRLRWKTVESYKHYTARIIKFRPTASTMPRGSDSPTSRYHLQSLSQKECEVEAEWSWGWRFGLF